jgi:hypothetical protein
MCINSEKKNLEIKGPTNQRLGVFLEEEESMRRYIFTIFPQDSSCNAKTIAEIIYP